MQADRLIMVAESHETAVPEVDLLRTSHKQELEWFRHVPLVSMILQYAASGASPPLIHVVSMVCESMQTVLLSGILEGD